MNMIYENWRISASNDPFVRAFSWLLCFVSLHGRCRYSELNWSLFSHIWTEYEERVRISPYSIELLENTDQKNSKYGHCSCSVCFNLCFCSLLNTCIYCNNIESLKRKNSKYCLVCEAVNPVFGNIFRQYFWWIWRGS